MKDKDFHCKPPEEYTWRIEAWSEDYRLFVGAYPDLSPELAKEQAKRIFDRFAIDAKSVVAVPVVGYPPISEEYWKQEKQRLSILLQPSPVVAAKEVLEHDGKASKLQELLGAK